MDSRARCRHASAINDPQNSPPPPWYRPLPAALPGTPGGTPAPSVVGPGPSRPLLQFPATAPIVGAARLPGSGAGPTGGWGGWAGHAASKVSGKPGAAGRGGTRDSFSPRSRWHRRGVGGSPRARRQAACGGAAESRGLPAGCWRRKPADSFPTGWRAPRWRSEVLLPSPLGSPLAAPPVPAPAVPSPGPDRPPSRHGPLPRPPAFPPQLRHSTRGASPGPASPLAPPGAPALAPARPSRGAARSLGVPWRNPRPRPRSWKG